MIHMMKKIRTAGQALVEFTLAGTLIFFLLAAAVDLGMIFFALQGVHNAAQEGGLFAASMEYVDVGDQDQDSIERGDIYSTPLPYGIGNGKIFDNFYAEVRKRINYEAGQRGGIGFVNLRDLNSNGIRDDQETCKINGKDCIEVSVKDAQGKDCDPSIEGNDCTITIKVSILYHIQFPLAPALPDDKITLTSEFKSPANKTGFLQSSASDLTFNTTIPISDTATPTIIPTPTIPYSVCVGQYDNGLSGSDWQPTGAVKNMWNAAVIGFPNAYGRGNAENGSGPVWLCGLAEDVREQLYYIYRTREGNDPNTGAYNQQFTAQLTNWTPPDQGIADPSITGLMIRSSSSVGSRFAMVGYLPKSNKIAFWYRPTNGGTVFEVGSVSVSSGIGKYFRLIRTTNKVSAAYSDDGSTWTSLGSAGGVTVDLGESTMFGEFIASGYTAISDPVMFARRFAQATFENITIEPVNVPVVDFVVPVADGNEISSLNETMFKISISDTSHVSETIYRLIDPDGTILWAQAYSGAALCAFGGSCDKMPQDVFNMLQKRNPQEYTIEVEVAVDDPAIPHIVAQRTFMLPVLVFDFVRPNNNDLIDQLSKSDFLIHAYDPKVGTTPGDGIAKTEFYITRGTSPSDPPAIGHTYVTTGTNLLCLFGGTKAIPPVCNFMKVTDDTNIYYKLLGGTYTVWARVLPVGGNIWSDWKSRTFTIPDMNVAFTTPTYTDPNEVKVISKIEDSRFEANAFLPQFDPNNDTNGDGVEKLEFQVLEGNDTTNPFNNILYKNENATLSSGKFCMFGMDGTNCAMMPKNTTDGSLDYTKLVSGTYTIRVRALYKDTTNTWTDWVTRYIEIPPVQAHIEFVRYDDVSPNWNKVNSITYITDRVKQSGFRALAYVDSVGTNDGDGIAKVMFEIYKVVDGKKEVLKTVEDTTSPYCAFGEDTSKTPPICLPMDQTMFDEDMGSSTTYYVAARAQPTSQQRWTNPVEITYGIAPMVMRFVDPDNSPDENDSEFPYNIYNGYDDDDPTKMKNDDYIKDHYNVERYKIVRTKDDLKFQIEAFDPKYLDDGGAYNPPASDPQMTTTSEWDTLFAQNNAKGITNYEFRVCGPDVEEDTCKKDSTKAIDGQTINGVSVDLSGIRQPASSDPKMCAFGIGTSDCKTISDTQFNALNRGTYTLLARVANKVKPKSGLYSDDKGWTDWDKERWIATKFIYPPLNTPGLVNIMTGTNTMIPFETDVATIDDTIFGFIDAYDPIEGTEHGDGINKVKTEIVKKGSSTPIWSSEGSKTEFLAANGEWFCVFKVQSGNSCNTMPLDIYNTLAGEYDINISLKDSKGVWYPFEALGLFQTTPVPVDVAFKHSNIYTTTYAITDVNSSAATFEVEAYQTGSTVNGHGVQQVQMLLYGYTISVTQDLSVNLVDNGRDSSTPYCPFGSTGSTCNAIGNTIKNTLKSSTACNGIPCSYYEIWAKATADGVKWTDVKKQRFTLP